MNLYLEVVDEKIESDGAESQELFTGIGDEMLKCLNVSALPDKEKRHSLVSYGDSLRTS